MTIEEKDFKMTCSDGNRWDLELLYTVKPKGKPEREEFKLDGYGYTLSNALAKIINYRLANKKDVYSLKEYIQEYKKESNSVKQLFKDI